MFLLEKKVKILFLSFSVIPTRRFFYKYKFLEISFLDFLDAWIGQFSSDFDDLYSIGKLLKNKNKFFLHEMDKINVCSHVYRMLE